jgi:uncharacterized protein (TIGR02444 family)
MTMLADLWSFTLDFYARPGVEQACLSLQADGANVCALLCGVWMDRRGVQFDPQGAQQIGQLADPWHEQVVGPIRDIRTRWKDAATADEELTALRDRLKTLELDAERELLVRLQRLTRDWPERDAPPSSEWLEALAGAAAKASPDALQVLLRAGTEIA